MKVEMSSFLHSFLGKNIGKVKHATGPLDFVIVQREDKKEKITRKLANAVFHVKHFCLASYIL